MNYQDEHNIMVILDKAKAIPQQFSFIMNAISQKFNRNFDQLIINEYIAGQGISPHIDHIKLLVWGHLIQ